MKLDEVQAAVAERLAASDELAGVTVLLDDGLYPKIPALEAALETKGLALVVFEPVSAGTVAKGSGSVGALNVNVRVEILENVGINRGVTGTKIGALKATRLVLEAVSGQVQQGFRQTFVLADTAFSDGGTLEGLRHYNAVLEILIPITPPPK